MTTSSKPQTNFADCYVLTPNRTKVFILSFLEHFLPHRAEYASTYEVPQLSEHPTAIFHSAEHLIDYLVQHSTESYHLYWTNQEASDLRGGMCFFTTDGQIILNLFCETHYPDTSIEDRCLKELMNFCGSTQGLIEYELPAPRDTGEYLKRIAEQSRQ